MSTVIKLHDRGICDKGIQHFAVTKEGDERVFKFQCAPLEADEHMLAHISREAERKFGQEANMQDYKIFAIVVLIILCYALAIFGPLYIALHFIIKFW